MLNCGWFAALRPSFTSGCGLSGKSEPKQYPLFGNDRQDTEGEVQTLKN
jgi:hypothetical protein